MYLSKGDILKNGQYIIKDELGNGSYGITYKARDNFSKTDVAIKTLRNLDYKKKLNRFLKEIRALKELSRHSNLYPNIVKYLDDFSEGQKHYLVMKYLKGEILYDFVSKKKD